MDVSTIYTPKAAEAMTSASSATSATQGLRRFSPTVDVKTSLSMISDALDGGHKFDVRELIPVDILNGDGRSRQFWFQVSSGSSGTFEIVVPNPNKDGSVIGLIAEVSESRRVWKILAVKLVDRSLDDR